MRVFLAVQMAHKTQGRMLREIPEGGRQITFLNLTTTSGKVKTAARFEPREIALWTMDQRNVFILAK
ncbi:unnamed protein product [Brassica rapa subsp. narinosa]